MRYNIACVILLSCLLGCSETEYPHKFPIVLTEDVTEINSDGAKFSGRIQNLEGFKIISYGFVWDQVDNPTLTASKLSFSTNIKEGSFSEVIHNDLEDGKNYFVRAFIETDKVVVYGDSKGFASKGSVPPSIASFSPVKGIMETEIKIIGDNFSTNINGNRVTLGDVEFEIISASKNELIVKQPITQLVGPYPIVVEVAGQTTSSGTQYTIIGPIITSLPRTSGRVGDFLILNGEYLDAGYLLDVSFGEPEYGNSAEPFAISATQMGCYIPNYAGHTVTLRLSSLIQELDWKTFEYPEPFTIIDSWQRRSTTTPLEDFMGFTYARNNNLIYVIGGRALYEYNLSTGAWTRRKDFPGAYRFYATAFTYNGKLYYGFGEGSHEPYSGSNGQYYQDLWSYDPVSNSWTSLGDTPLASRSRAVALTVNNKIYVGFGGTAAATVTSYGDFWEYKASNNSWSQISTSAIQNGNLAFAPIGFSAANKAYFIGLHNPTNAYSSVVWEYNPATSQWTKKSDLPDWATTGPASPMGDHGLVICDTNGGVRTWEYDPSNDTWIRRQTLQVGIAPLKFGGYYQGKFHLGGVETWELSFD